MFCYFPTYFPTMSNLYHSLFNEIDHKHTNSDYNVMETHGYLDFNALLKSYDITSYNLTNSRESFQLSIIHMCSRSLAKISDNFQSFLACLIDSLDIIAFSESRLTENNKHFHGFTRYHSHDLARKMRAHVGISTFISHTKLRKTE